jgi:hypothetical protein
VSTREGAANPVVAARQEALAERVHRYIDKHPGCTGDQLQGAISGAHQNVYLAVRNLISARLIVRAPDPADRRVLLYAPAGEYEPPAEPRRCARCKRPLPPYKQRFCSEICLIRHRKKERAAPNTDYATYLANMIRRMGTRAIGDLDAVSELDAMAGVLDRALAEAVDGCRAQGHSDAQIGQALGTTKQAVQKRFPRQPKVVAEVAGPGGAA